MALPNFLIVGAARSGTTALHYELAQHPEICMSTIKEPNFFVFDDGRPLIQADQRLLVKSVPDRRGYEQLFRPGRGERAVGEASPLYLYVRESPELIERALSDVRLIAVLRQPVERAYSHFLQIERVGEDAVGERFRTAVERERALGYEPYHAGTHYLRPGRYHEQLSRYWSRFGQDRMLVLRYEELEASPRDVLARICRFLGVDDSFAFDTSQSYNRSGVPRGGVTYLARRAVARVQPYVKAALPTRAAAALGRARARTEHAAVRRPPPVDPDLSAELMASYFAGEVEGTERLAGLDLSAWRRA